MANVLASYNPIQYAQEALAQLEKVLGMARLVYRGYSKTPGEQGDTITIRKPGTFTAQAMPISTAEDLDPGDITVKIDQWWGVLYALRDDELNFTQQQIIDEHLRPAAYAMSDKFDTNLFGLVSHVPHHVEDDSSNPEKDFTALRKKMHDVKVPSDGRAFVFDGTQEKRYLDTSLFHQANTSSDGGATQREGFLGRKFGFANYVMHNIPSITGGTGDAGTAVVNGDQEPTDSDEMDSVSLSAVAGDLVLKEGDILGLNGTTEEDVYAVTADVTISSGSSGSVGISPTLRKTISDSDSVAVIIDQSTPLVNNVAFRRDAFALAMAPMSDLGQGIGAEVGVAESPQQGLTLRSRRWYDPKEAKVYIGLDALWGVKAHQPDQAVRLMR